MPKRIQFNSYGGPEVLHYCDCKPPALGPRDVLVRNHAIGLNYIDTYYRGGLYPVPALPSGLGTEGAGVIEAVGAEVSRFKAGDRVAYASGPLGAYAEYHALPEGATVRIPDTVSFEQAAAVMLKGLTVQYLLRQTYPLRGGETILFHAAAGGVGLIACQWAKALGVKLIGTAGNAGKAALARAHGAWEAVDMSREDFVARVHELTGGEKCPVVYDSVGRDTWERSLDCVTPRGLMVSFGNSSGPVTGVDLGVLSRKGSLYVTRPTLAHYANTPERLAEMSAELFALIGAGLLRVEINQRFPLAEAAAAHTALQSRRTTGSTVLVP
ncbi:NADPH2:quinone reductase [Ereboglobus sp. PH5-5]|uniref:NADPH:quinone reductase n=1 Tax=Ereboglobus sp. PH5-5 TaxID=2940529 RepID=UPI002407221F|nr:NADPH:quinone reductase [Ereboglobus sp. PH5-5]MDF9832810.1 NADPH2:quinone reductase [Ereboglobus sp. PH5-5]